MYELNYRGTDKYRCDYTSKKLQLKHRWKCLSQWLSRPEFAVIGGYHYGNAGDIALGTSLVQGLAALGQPAQLQTLYNLDRWPHAKYAILGGGAITYEDAFAKVYERYRQHPERLAILGVDMQGKSALSQKYGAFLREVAFISCRSSEQVDVLRDMVGREDGVYHQDLCISKFSASYELKKSAAGTRVLGLNMVPHFMRNGRSGKFIPGARSIASIKSSFPELLPHVDKLGELYVRFFRKLCMHYHEQGYELRHLPFTPQDDLFARSALAGLPLQFAPYTIDINRMLEAVSYSSTFLCTRFHSLIFASITQTPMIPYLYAGKCRRFARDMQLQDAGLVTIHDLLEQFESTCDRVLVHGPVVIDNHRLEQAATNVRSSIQDAYQALGF